MRPTNAIASNETLNYRHRSTQFIHDLSSCISLAMSNRLSSRRPSFWSEERTSCLSRGGSLSNQSRNQFQSLSPILNSHDTYICCSYSPRCFIIQKVKPSTLQSTLCTSSNSCESATNSVQTSTILKAKRCTNHDRKKINGNHLDTQELIKKVESPEEHEFMITTDNKINKSQTNSINESKEKMNVSIDDNNHNNSIMISSSLNNNAINDESVVNNTNKLSHIKYDTKDNDNNEMSSKIGVSLEELKSLLQHQLEYYFSRENLARDTYLISQMDSDQYVPISIVANFDQIKKLTDNKQIVVDVLRESPSVQVDESGEKVRPNHKRCVLILREIPESTLSNDIKNLFSGKNCPKFVSCEFAHNGSWYVTFETDEDAQRAYRYIREEVKIFPATGKPIMARIKAKPILHSVSALYNKNGFRPTVPLSADTTPNSISNSNNETFNSNSEPLLSQQNFSYANVPTVNFNSRIYPPFYPPSMLQAWTPTTSAFYDLSTVFVANGLAPHAYGSQNRQNYHSNKSTALRNNNTKPHSNRKNHFHSNNNNNSSIGSISSSSSTTSTGSGVTLSTNGCSVNTTDNIANNLNNSRFNAKHFSNSKTSIANNNSGVENDSNASIGGAVVDVSPLVSTKIGASAQSNSSPKSHFSQSVEISCENNRSNSPLNAQRNKGRGRKRKEENGIDSMNSHYSDSSSAGKPANTKIIINSGLNEPFDLKATSFPPLPSSVKSCSIDNVVNEESVTLINHCSSLADVVKGTVKQRDNRCKFDSFDSISSSNGSKNEVSAAVVHIITNTSNPLKLSKDIKNKSTNSISNTNTNTNNCSPNNKEDMSKIRTKTNSNLNSNINDNKTSHVFDNSSTNAKIPAKTLNHCPLQTSTSSLGFELSSESSQENEHKDSFNAPKVNPKVTPIVLNGINDTFSINSDSFDENDEHNEHSSATQSQPSSPNSQTNQSLKSLNLMETHEDQCNGRLDSHNEDNSSQNDGNSDRTDSPLSTNQNCSKKLTYSEIAQRARDKQNQELQKQHNSGPKDKDSISSNSSTSSKASVHLSSNSGRYKLKTVIDQKDRGLENHGNRSFYRNKDIRRTHDVHDRNITPRVK